MLDQKDLDVFEEILETIAEKSEESILNKVDERLEKSESLILDEVERIRNILDNRIDKVQKNLESRRVEELERRTA